jgi:hypothetical protein
LIKQLQAYGSEGHIPDPRQAPSFVDCERIYKFYHRKRSSLSIICELGRVINPDLDWQLLLSAGINRVVFKSN